MNSINIEDVKKYQTDKNRGVKNFFRIIYENKKSFVGLIILIIFAIMATIGPEVINLDLSIKFSERYQGISAQHLLGTDFGGRDTFAQMVHGSREVLTVGALAAIFTISIGFIIGAVSGLLGGWFDVAIMFITNLFLTIPSFPIMMIMSALVKIDNPIMFAFILSIWSWGGLARSIRSQILSLKHRDFIVACRIMGMSTRHIVFKEIMPNLVSYIAINFIQIMQGAIISSVGIMTLGFAPYSPTNWGMMLNLAIQNTGGMFNSSGYLYLAAPIVCLGLFQMGCIFFANGVDEALNPRLRGE